MEMTELDIVRDYGQAANKAAQIGILADLNMCSAADIVEVLQKNGIPLPQGVTSKKQKQYRRPAAGRVEWTEENIARLHGLVSEGLSLYEIADCFGTGVTAISKQIAKHDLRGKKAKRQKRPVDPVDDSYIKQLEQQLKEAKEEKQRILAEHNKVVADYTEIVVGLEEELAQEKERCAELAGELHRFFEKELFLEIERQAKNIKGLAVLGLCAIGKPTVDEAIRSAFLNIAESADGIMEEMKGAGNPEVLKERIA